MWVLHVSTCVMGEGMKHQLLDSAATHTSSHSQCPWGTIVAESDTTKHVVQESTIL